jgi:hypothetical protein
MHTTPMPIKPNPARNLNFIVPRQADARCEDRALNYSRPAKNSALTSWEILH